MILYFSCQCCLLINLLCMIMLWFCGTGLDVPPWDNQWSYAGEGSLLTLCLDIYVLLLFLPNLILTPYRGCERHIEMNYPLELERIDIDSYSSICRGLKSIHTVWNGLGTKLTHSIWIYHKMVCFQLNVNIVYVLARPNFVAKLGIMVPVPI